MQKMVQILAIIIFPLMAHTTFPKPLITDNILLGTSADAQDHDELLRYGVTHILNLTVSCLNAYPESFFYLKPMIRGNISTFTRFLSLDL
jgi:hypothetical protein